MNPTSRPKISCTYYLL